MITSLLKSLTKTLIIELIISIILGIKNKDDIKVVICANIIADVIFMLSPELKAKLNEGGYLVLSGILDRYKQRILAEFSELELIKNISKNEWESFIYQKIAK